MGQAVVATRCRVLRLSSSFKVVFSFLTNCSTGQIPNVEGRRQRENGHLITEKKVAVGDSSHQQPQKIIQ